MGRTTPYNRKDFDYAAWQHLSTLVGASRIKLGLNRMLWAVYQQNLDPIHNRLLSTVFAALPVLVLFWLLVPRRWPAPKAGFAGAITAILVAWLVYQMPLGMA